MDQFDLIFEQTRGIVGIFGPDGRAFLQKMSTNDLSLLSPKCPLPTCFVDNKGRLIDFVFIFERAPDEFLLVSSHPAAQVLMDWLGSYQFIEDFSINNFDAKYRFWWEMTRSTSSPLLGPSAQAGHFFSAAGAKNSLDFWGHLGESCPQTSAPPAQWQALRISAGIPEIPQEICSKYMPQNVGLGSFIANNKGCYIGQEVVAKAITYQKHPKFLVGLKLSEQEYLIAQVGDKVFDTAGHEALISSKAPIYQPNIVTALAIAEGKSAGAVTAGSPIKALQTRFETFYHKYPVRA